jgi:hypothetical protein
LDYYERAIASDAAVGATNTAGLCGAASMYLKGEGKSNDLTII